MKCLRLMVGVFFSTALFGQGEQINLSMGAGYQQQVYYSLKNGVVASHDLAAWDLAFEVSPMGGAIRFNRATDSKLYNYPNGNASDWLSLDTAGLNSWKEVYDTDTAWTSTAFNRFETDVFDLGWGRYNMVTHATNGDSLHVVQFADKSVKKLLIKTLSKGEYEFVYANLDGSDSVNVKLNKDDYPNRNFAYYSLKNNESLDLEPHKDEWDLVFTKYITTLPGFGAYGVSGVLLNEGIKAAEITNADTAAIDTAGMQLSANINVIGYDWKSFNRNTFQFDLADSVVFVIKDKEQEYWQVVFTEFSGQSTGDLSFVQKPLSIVNSVFTVEKKLSVKMYPNPIKKGNSLNIHGDVIGANFVLYNQHGQQVYQTVLKQNSVQLSELQSGVYHISIQSENGFSNQSLIVK